MKRFLRLLVATCLLITTSADASNSGGEILRIFTNLLDKHDYFEARYMLENVKDFNLLKRLFAITIHRKDCRLLKNLLDIARNTQNIGLKDIIKMHRTTVEERFLVCAIDRLSDYLREPNSKLKGILSTLDQLPQDLQQRIVSNAIGNVHQQVNVKKLLMALRLSWYRPYNLYIVAFLLRKLRATNRLNPQTIVQFAKHLRIIGNTRGLHNVAALNDVRQFEDVRRILPQDIRRLFFAKRVCLRNKNTLYYLAQVGASYSASFGVQGGAYWEATPKYEEGNIVLTNTKTNRSLAVYLRDDFFVPTEVLTKSVLLDGVHRCAGTWQLVPFVTSEDPKTITYLLRTPYGNDLVCVRDGAISYDGGKTVADTCMWELCVC